jgi:hypothetical protein
MEKHSCSRKELGREAINTVGDDDIIRKNPKQCAVCCRRRKEKDDP